ncbi:MAG: type II toxin-antitoxin system VapB family antitoxin [Pirellulales bacterium]|nr:type II toxin-antitoxin system VapB family antitoxin [Pirellulales bacterium]
MRTTIRLDDQLLADAKMLAAKSGKTLNAVIEDSLRAALARQAKEKGGGHKTVKLPRMSGEGLRPGVSLDSNADLFDLMEQDLETNNK